MLVSVLASGSRGNATLIKTAKYNLLIDAGMSCQYLERNLQKHHLQLKDIDYVLLTHTHIDHTSALNNFIKKHQPILIMTDKMFFDLKYLRDYEQIQILLDDIELDGLLIESIKTSHDTSDSRGYIITEGNASVVIITDTGYLNQKYFPKLTDKTLYIFESNHNVEMLMYGKYPKWVKRRVGSDVGHLSNEASSYYLTKIIGPHTKYIILAHISDENNTPEIALATLRAYFAEQQINFDNIIAAKQHEQTEGIEI